MDLAAIASLPPDQLRALLPAFVAGFIAEPATSARCREEVGALVAGWSDPQLAGVLEALVGVGAEHVMYRANPECRALARHWARFVLTASRVEGADTLREAMARGPVAVVGNHLSYYDTGATDAALVWAGFGDVADRLVAAAGPKVYAALFRRVAAASLNTLPVPQSTSLGHTEQITPRELARRALASLAAADAMFRDGYALLVYPEGSRTRTGRMRPFLKAVHRYLAHEGLSVVPLAITGTDRVMGLADDRIHPGPVTLRFGAPFPVAGDPRAALERAHAEVAELLPEAYRPDPSDPAVV